MRPVEAALAQLPAKIPPLPFESAMAERVLESDFGTYIEQLSQRVENELTSGSAAIVFVSMERDEQRAKIVSGLAMHICGRLESKTLLVDADVQSNKISHHFRCSGPGLAESLYRDFPWYEGVVATSCEKLRVFPIGVTRLDNKSDDVTEAARKDFDQWRSQFGLVIIDGGTMSNPLMPWLVQFADAVYLCVQLGADGREELESTTEQLADWGANLKGCITNGTSARLNSTNDSLTMFERITEFLESAERRMRIGPTSDQSPQLLFPGSFHPLHQGHLGMAQYASQRLGVDAEFEISVTNVDKPALSAQTIGSRLRQFDPEQTVWLTKAPRFVDKTAIFPGATFILGADTVQRLVDPKYYGEPRIFGNPSNRSPSLAVTSWHSAGWMTEPFSRPTAWHYPSGCCTSWNS